MKIARLPNEHYLAVGDKVTQYLHVGMGTGNDKLKITGEVIWIHPKGRFYRLKFIMPNGSVITESYAFHGRYEGRNAYAGKEQ